MEKKLEWKLVNAENVVPYVCGPEYSSRMLIGDEMAGHPVINVNEGTLAPHTQTGGGVHELTEIYYVAKCKDGCCYVGLDDEKLLVKNGDFIVIPGGVFHWIDNTQSDEEFKIITFWTRQEENELFFTRFNAWGTSVRNLDDDYTAKRMAASKE